MGSSCFWSFLDCCLDGSRNSEELDGRVGTAGLLLVACSTNWANIPAAGEKPALKDTLPPSVALNVQNQVSELLGMSADSIQIQNVERTNWPNSCLGLPRTDETCTQVITPGWLLAFNINSREYRYWVDLAGTVIRQEL